MYTPQNRTATTQLTPAQIGTMLAQRRERASREAGNYGLFRQPNGVWSVVSLKGAAPTVYECDGDRCTCPDFARHGADLVCKHCYLVRTAEEDRLAEIQRERVREARRTMELDYPTDEYDRKPTHNDPFGPLPDPMPEARWWEDQMRAAEYADWLSDQMDSGLNYPCD